MEKVCGTKRIFISSLLAFFSSLSFGQSFHFPDSNSIWSVYDEKYFVQGDTVFNSLRYKKYYKSFDSTITSGSYFAMLREDTITNRIYAIPAGGEHEYLLYDLSLGINDTCWVYPLSFIYYSGPIIVKALQIDSILLNGQYRMRIKVEGYEASINTPEYWIEGIGSTFGIFNSGVSGLGYADISYPTLLCFEQNDTLIFDNPLYSDCYEPYPPAGGMGEDLISRHIKIYPNPTQNIVTVNFSEPSQLGQKELIIYNNLGAEIIEVHVPSGNVKQQIDVTNLSPGFYILRINTKDRYLANKKFAIIQ